MEKTEEKNCPSISQSMEIFTELSARTGIIKTSKRGKYHNYNVETTHCVSLQQHEHSENDGLYSIYGFRVGQSPEFMRDWLHYFITTVYKNSF